MSPCGWPSRYREAKGAASWRSGEAGSRGDQTGEAGSSLRAQTGKAHLMSCKAPVFSAALLSSSHWPKWGSMDVYGGIWASGASLTKYVPNYVAEKILRTHS